MRQLRSAAVGILVASIMVLGVVPLGAAAEEKPVAASGTVVAGAEFARNPLTCAMKPKPSYCK